MEEQTHRTARLIAVIAATTTSLACGTNVRSPCAIPMRRLISAQYAYSAWGPQFADRLKLSATQSNLIGAAGNMGMYASGIPFGHMVDTRGPKLGSVLGGLMLGAGYFPIKKAYDDGAGSMSVLAVCFFSFLSGCGSCTAFLAAIKVAAVNWPLHRGTATAFPLSAFGLSALFFTLLSGFAFPDDTSKLLLFLALGSLCLILVPTIFMRVPHPNQYQAIAQGDEQPANDRRDSNHLERTSSWLPKSKNGQPVEEPSKCISFCCLSSVPTILP